LEDVFCSDVSSRMTKFSPSTRPGRLSNTTTRAYSYTQFWLFIGYCRLCRLHTVFFM